MEDNMSEAISESRTIPADIAAVLDPQLSQELIEEVTVGQSAYYIIVQGGEEVGGLVVVRQTPGSKPEVIAADTSLVTPDGGPLPREVTEALEAIFGKPEVETEELQPSLVERSVAPSATREDVSERLFKKAQELNGRLSSHDVPGTLQGKLACAWAVNEVARRALGYPIGGDKLVLNMHKVLLDRHTGVSEANASEGMIIISCSQGSFHGHDHVGIVGEKIQGDRKVYSNSSSRALWMQNYTVDKWRADFHGKKGLPVEFFQLNPRYFPSGDQPPYPGTPLQEGSRDEDVRTVQQRLNALGSKLETDGIFGKATLEAVIAFQKRMHLDPDGVVGPKTWAALWSTH
jgi:Putative peptidoglycan binding domain